VPNRIASGGQIIAENLKVSLFQGLGVASAKWKLRRQNPPRVGYRTVFRVTIRSPQPGR